MAAAELPLSPESAPDPGPDPGPGTGDGVVGGPAEEVAPAAPDAPDAPDAVDAADEAGGASVEGPVAAPASPGAVSGDYRMALVTAVTVDLPNPHPTVVLRESESPRRQLSFSIAMPDAIVLSHALRRIATPRPLTHELVTGILQKFDIDVVAVRLVGRQGSVYFAELDLRGRTGRSVHSCRPSDALTLALQQAVPVPILIDRRLFEQVGDVAPPGPSTSGS
jgi:bifunctional DNase/RNase